MRVREFMEILEELAPASLAEPWDNVGLQVGRSDRVVSRVLVSLDASEHAVDRAVAGPYDALLTHHPLLFPDLHRITDADRVGRSLHALIEAGVTLVALHTNLDAAPGGLCAIAAEALGLEGMRPLVRAPLAWRKLVGFVPPEHLEAVSQAVFAAGAGVIGEYAGCAFRTSGEGSFIPGASADPYIGAPGVPELAPEVRWETVVPESRIAAAVAAFIDAHPYEEPAFDLYPLENLRVDAGAGRVGTLASAMSLDGLTAEVAARVGAETVTVSGEGGRNVERVAIVTGSGASFIDAATGQADVLITGDVKYHDAEKARDRGLALISVPHDVFEGWALERWSRTLAERVAPRGVEVEYKAVGDSPWRVVTPKPSGRGRPVNETAVASGDTLFPLGEEPEAVVSAEPPPDSSVTPANTPKGARDAEEKAPARDAGSTGRRFELWTDGGSRGNPGPSAIGVVLRDDAGGVIEEVSAHIGDATNNVAEYQALITGLETAAERGVTVLSAYLDSELVVKQLRGEYRVKNEQLRPLYERAKELLGGFPEVEVRHVPRAQNTRADELVNEALDGAE